MAYLERVTREPHLWDLMINNLPNYIVYHPTKTGKGYCGGPHKEKFRQTVTFKSWRLSKKKKRYSLRWSRWEEGGSGRDTSFRVTQEWSKVRGEASFTSLQRQTSLPRRTARRKTTKCYPGTYAFQTVPTKWMCQWILYLW